MNEQDPDAVFETDPNFAFLRERYPYRYWSRKVAVMSKHAPISPPIYGFPSPESRYDAEDARARCLTLEFEHLFLVTTYVPNSGSEFKNLERRKLWAADFEPHLRALDARKPVVWCGDFNVVRTVSPDSNETNDLQWPQNMGRVAGTHQVERDAHERLLGPQPWLKDPKRPGPLFVDVWRLIHGPEWRQYTYVSLSLLRGPEQVLVVLTTFFDPLNTHLDTKNNRHSSKKLGGWRSQSLHLRLPQRSLGVVVSPRLARESAHDERRNGTD